MDGSLAESTGCCSVLQRVAVCWNVLKVMDGIFSVEGTGVAGCCSVLLQL